MENVAFSISLSEELHSKLEFIAKQGVPKRTKTGLIRHVLQIYVDNKLKDIPHLDEVLQAMRGVDPVEAIDEEEEELESVKIDG